MAITNFISTVWSENLLKQLGDKYVGVLNCNREFEGDIKNKGSKVKICGVGDVLVSDYTKDTDMSSPSTLSDYGQTLEINQAKYFNFQIDDVDRAQSNPKLMDEAMRNAANALAREADKYIYGLYTEGEFDKVVDSPQGINIIETLIDIKTQLLKQGTALSDDIVIEVSPEVAGIITKTKINLGLEGCDTLETGLLGKIVGCKVYVSNNIVIDNNGYHKCFVRTKRAIAFAEQISEVEAYRPEKRFADAVKGLHLYGAKVVYPKELVVLSIKMA